MDRKNVSYFLHFKGHNSTGKAADNFSSFYAQSGVYRHYAL